MTSPISSLILHTAGDGNLTLNRQALEEHIDYHIEKRYGKYNRLVGGGSGGGGKGGVSERGGGGFCVRDAVIVVWGTPHYLVNMINSRTK